MRLLSRAREAWFCGVFYTVVILHWVQFETGFKRSASVDRRSTGDSCDRSSLQHVELWLVDKDSVFEKVGLAYVSTLTLSRLTPSFS